ncbi:MAG: homoserine dehydrogenase [Chloroflexota bacterium]
MNILPIILFGIGGVGGTLVQQICAQRAYHADQYNLEIRVLAVCDSRGAVINTESGLDDAQLQDILVFKENGGRLTEHTLGTAQNSPEDVLQSVMNANLGEQMLTPVVVDCTASDTTVPALLATLAHQYKIVLANKKPLTVNQEVYDRLTKAGVTSNSDTTENSGTRDLAHARWETTVGAGLPMISTLNRLMASGDAVNRIAGTFSGTLGYVMTGLQAGRPLSEIVREAHSLGYTEPDPRDDLGGVDVARKALILARGQGWQIEMEDVDVTGLYPPTMDDLSVDAFMDALTDLDDEFAQRVRNAEAEGKVLRYAATISANEDGTGGTCSVGPTLVDGDSPLGRLSGTDNLAEFHTRWYSTTPLVIHGAGAGTEVTAAGVLSDIVELAYTG